MTWRAAKAGLDHTARAIHLMQHDLLTQPLKIIAMNRMLTDGDERMRGTASDLALVYQKIAVQLRYIDAFYIGQATQDGTLILLSLEIYCATFQPRCNIDGD